MQSNPLQTSKGLPCANLRAERMAAPSESWISAVMIAGEPEAWRMRISYSVMVGIWWTIRA